MRHERHGQADGRPREERRAPPGERFSQIEDRDGRQRGDQAHEHDDPPIARRGVGGKHDDRQAGCVDRVDRAVLTATQEVGPQVPAEKLAVLAALVVVLDPQVAVGKQALGNDQIVRLVAARSDHARRVHAEEQIKSQARGKHEFSAGHLRLGGDQRDQTRTNRQDARERDGRNDPSDRAREHQQQRHAVWQPGQIRHDPQPEQAKRCCHRGEPRRQTSLPAQGRERQGQEQPDCDKPAKPCQRRKQRDALGARFRPIHDVDGSRDEPGGRRDGFDGSDKRRNMTPRQPTSRTCRRAHIGLRSTAM